MSNAMNSQIILVAFQHIFCKLQQNTSLTNERISKILYHKNKSTHIKAIEKTQNTQIGNHANTIKLNKSFNTSDRLEKTKANAKLQKMFGKLLMARKDYSGVTFTGCAAT